MATTRGVAAGLAILVTLFTAVPGSADTDIAPRESGVQRVRFTSGQKTLYNYRWELARDGRFVAFTGRGDNDKSGAARVEWVETARMELTADGLRTLAWTKDSSGAEQESWRIEYDWAARRATWTYRDRTSDDEAETKTLTFGPRAFAADNMYFFLRGFPFEQGEGAQIEGEFVLTDGKVMKGSVVHRGEERLETAFGPMDTYKLEFKPGGLVGALAPRMYIWYTKSAPHLFLRFDGRDEGVTSARTTNELIRYAPEERIRPPAAPAPATAAP
jgi:hypothetical protein